MPATYIITHKLSVSQTEELAAEKYRVNLLYKLICEHGMMHVEDLYREYLRMNVMVGSVYDNRFAVMDS